MADKRKRKWKSVPGPIGGLIMFVIEGLMVFSLAVAGWVLAVVILAII
jgi:hypothetical protein